LKIIRHKLQTEYRNLKVGICQQKLEKFEVKIVISIKISSI